MSVGVAIIFGGDAVVASDGLRREAKPSVALSYKHNKTFPLGDHVIAVNVHLLEIGGQTIGQILRAALLPSSHASLEEMVKDAATVLEKLLGQHGHRDEDVHLIFAGRNDLAESGQLEIRGLELAWRDGVATPTFSNFSSNPHLVTIGDGHARAAIEAEWKRNTIRSSTPLASLAESLIRVGCLAASDIPDIAPPTKCCGGGPYKRILR
ncbi:MAG: hypothetical protein U0174_14035 [Polyangiaceae bacterium]